MTRKRGKGELATPQILVPAIQFLTYKFDDADRCYGQLSSFVCRGELHRIPIDANSLQIFQDLKQSMSVEASHVLSERIAQKTASAIIQGYLGFYISCATSHACDWYKECAEVARANCRHLSRTPEEWALLKAQNMIRGCRHYVQSWLQSVCDNRSYRPAKANNQVLLDPSWRPPLLLLMAPFTSLPSGEKQGWNRGDERMGEVVQSWVADKYEHAILHQVEHLARAEQFNALRIADANTTELASDSTSNRPPLSPSANVLPGRELRRKKTQEKYRVWQTEFRKLKKAFPGHSDVWYSKKIAMRQPEKKPSSETVRKHMKKAGRR